jgi:hypothetical protein
MKIDASSAIRRLCFFLATIIALWCNRVVADIASTEDAAVMSATG